MCRIDESGLGAIIWSPGENIKREKVLDPIPLHAAQPIHDREEQVWQPARAKSKGTENPTSTFKQISSDQAVECVRSGCHIAVWEKKQNETKRHSEWEGWKNQNKKERKRPGKDVCVSCPVRCKISRSAAANKILYLHSNDIENER